MNDLRKAAQQALDALESVYGRGKRCEAAMMSLRQALAQPDEVLAEREACARLFDEVPDDDFYCGSQYAAAIRARGEK